MYEDITALSTALQDQQQRLPIDDVTFLNTIQTLTVPKYPMAVQNHTIFSSSFA